MKTEQRPVPERKHPIFTKKCMIATPPIEELCAIAIDLIDNATPGALFWALSRTGKSTWIEFLKKEIEAESPGAPVIVMEAWAHDRPSQAAFFEDILVAGDHMFARDGRRPEVKKARTFQFLLNLGLNCADQRVVLVIDEAQNLSDQNLVWLAGIHNTLARRGVALMTLLVGQEELHKKRIHLVRAKKQNLVGRFMVHVAQFHGIRTKDELKSILQTYDNVEFPEDSGWSYSRFFADAEFRKGWRLANWASLIWQGFEDAMELVQENAPKELKMEYVARTIERILKGVAGIDIRDKKAAQRLAERSIAQSGFLNELELIAEVTAEESGRAA